MFVLFGGRRGRGREGKLLFESLIICGSRVEAVGPGRMEEINERDRSLMEEPALLEHLTLKVKRSVQRHGQALGASKAAHDRQAAMTKTSFSTEPYKRITVAGCDE